MLKILVDTCVWLDMAKTPAQSKNLGILLHLRYEKLIDIIVPELVIDEFNRNRDRMIVEYAKSVTTTLSRAKEIVVQQGGRKRSNVLLRLFDAIDNPIKTPKTIAEEAADLVETLLQAGDLIKVNDAMKLRASDRAMNKRAPFHRDKNSFNDALIIETYADYIKQHANQRARFAFVTHNVRDFSDPAGNHKLPHPDFANLFSKRTSRYCINISDALNNMHLKALGWLYRTDPEVRSVSDIIDAIDDLEQKIWYDRHMVSRRKIDHGVEKVVPTLPGGPWPERRNLIQQDVWEGALKSAAKVERRFGKDNLGPYSKFDWGMMNGKLSALRWVLGDDWDMLDS